MAVVDFTGEALAPKAAAKAAEFQALLARVKSLEDTLTSVRSQHALELKYAKAEVALAMQPQLQASYEAGYAACKQSLKDAQELMQARF
jgi:hypothetical protein